MQEQLEQLKFKPLDWPRPLTNRRPSIEIEEMIRASFIDQHFKNSILKYILYLVILRTVFVISAIFDNVARKYNANHFDNSDSNSSSSNDCNVIR